MCDLPKMTTQNRLSKKSAEILKLISEGHSYSQIVDGQKGVAYPDIFKAAEEAGEDPHGPSQASVWGVFQNLHDQIQQKMGDQHLLESAV